MNIKLILSLLVCVWVPEFAVAKDSKTGLSQLNDVEVGMSRAEFFIARPKIAAEVASDPREAKRKDGLFREEFSAGDFDSAVYIFKNGKLAAISLYVTKDRDMTTEKRRQRIYKDRVGKWGGAQKKVGRMGPGSKKVQERSSAAVWNVGGLRSMLIAPGEKRAKAPKLVLTLLAPDTQESPAFEEETVPEQAKEIAFKEAGLVE